jgi:ferrochelatase
MKGVLLIQLGTPTAPTTSAVRRYLREFLSDPWVLDISAPARWALLNLIILPFRPKKSAHAYQQIWTDEGSPLMIHSVALTDRLADELGQDHSVALGMRYGHPSIPEALQQLDAAGATEIVVLPLYPQYAMSSTGTGLAALYAEAGRKIVVPPLQVIPDFYDHPLYLDACAALIQNERVDFEPDHVLFSYHGLPERQVKKSDRSGTHCLSSETCCDRITPANRSCYRAQCYATTRGLTERLDLAQDDFSMGFQSRLGRTPWIQPYTDDLLVELVNGGVKRLLVTCPSFVSDCLETLEEIGIRAKKDFIAAGGEDLKIVPCLNSDPDWIQAVASMVRSQTPSA